jgi:Zn finger protein HypA/HybF involved in hydrogenase expression
MKYWCNECERELSEHEVHKMSHLGLMCGLCRSGKVTPIEEKKK